jgi:UDP-glucose 4-epimerase
MDLLDQIAPAHTATAALLTTENSTRIMVTGGGGYLGAHVVAALARHGYGVVVVDRFQPESSSHRQVRHEVADITDLGRLTALVEHYRPAWVFHAAALAGARVPGDHVRQNVHGTRCVLQASLAAGVRGIVNTSSGLIYGNRSQPTLETAAPSGLDEDALEEFARSRHLSPYAWSKLLAETEIARLPADGPRVLSFRLGNCYGPPAEGFGPPDQGVVGRLLRALQRGEPLGVADTGRDFVHVEDVAAAYLLAMESPTARGPYNIGSGTSWSVIEVARELCRVRGIDPGSGRITPLDPDPRDVTNVHLDISRARRELGWSPTVALADWLKAIG